MFKHRNKKGKEFEKTRLATKREENLKLFKEAYKALYYFLLIIFLSVAVYCIFFSPFLSIIKVEIEGLESLKKEKVLSVVEEAYSGKYLHFIPKNNYVLFPSDSVEQSLMDSFKRIKKTTVTKRFPDTIHVRVEERHSLVLWCTPGQECFVMDEGGFAYSKVSLDSKDVLENNLVRINSGEEGRIINEGERILNAEKVAFLLAAKDKFSDAGITGDIYIKSRMAEEFSLRAAEGWDVLLSTNFPLEKMFETWDAFLHKELQDSNKRKDLEYVDLRVENRAYYKIKGSESEKESSQEDADKEKAQVDANKADVNA